MKTASLAVKMAKDTTKMVQVVRQMTIFPVFNKAAFKGANLIISRKELSKELHVT